MPELPEVETMRRGIAHLAGRRIESVVFPRGPVRPLAITPAPAALRRRLAGRSIAAVQRYGKRLALALSARGGRGDAWLVIEPRMTGLLLVAEPPSREHVRMVVDFGSGAGSRLVFWDRRGLGTIRLLDRRGLAAACGPTALGTDGLLVTGEELRAALGDSRRAVKVALLDQRAVAGIGNIYAAEILHRAGIDPRSRCRRLSAAAWERIAVASRAILADAVACRGSTIGDRTYTGADGRAGSFQRRHRVYGREGLACMACGTAVVRFVQSQRSTFFCPACQPRPRG